MPSLKAHTPYEGYTQDWDGLQLKEISGFEIISLAIAQGHELKGDTPKPGTWTKYNDGKLLWTGQNQYFLFKDGSNERLDEKLSEDFGENVFCTLQTDGWAALQINGERALDVLERFISLDLRSALKNYGTRSSAHHMSVIIMKIDDQTYHMFTPRSSSNSFLESLQDVISNILA